MADTDIDLIAQLADQLGDVTHRLREGEAGIEASYVEAIQALLTEAEDAYLAATERADGADDSPLMAWTNWATNAEMMRDIALSDLGYLHKDWTICDPTYGLGITWKLWRAVTMILSDLNPRKSPTGTAIDACDLPLQDDSVDVHFLDGPYKLNGKADVPVDSRYGVDEWASAPARIRLICMMMTEGNRVLRPWHPDRPSGKLMVKCQAQVNSGSYWPQPMTFTEHGQSLGLELIDEILYPSYRPQPRRSTCVHCGEKLMLRKDGMWGTVKRSVPVTFTCTRPNGAGVPEAVPHEPGRDEQDHAARNYSTLLVFQKT